MDLNVDLGELEDEPEALFGIATVANVACGGHAGGGALLGRALDRAARARTRVAAHPSYPDRAGFGRTARFCPPAETRAAVEAQCSNLLAAAKPRGIEIASIKPHGALYHDAAQDADYAGALLDAAAAALPALRSVVGPPDTILEDIAKVRGFSYEREGFVDRRYDEDFRLVPRSRPDALLTDPETCVSQALMLAKVGRFDTLCMHGDTPGAVAIGIAVRRALDKAGLLERKAVADRSRR